MPQGLLSFKSLDSGARQAVFRSHHLALDLAPGSLSGRSSGEITSPLDWTPVALTLRELWATSCHQRVFTWRGASHAPSKTCCPGSLLAAVCTLVNNGASLPPTEGGTQPGPQTWGPGKEAPLASTRQEMIPGVACQDARAGRIPMKRMSFSSAP